MIHQDIFGSSDPFLRLSRVNEAGTAVPVYRTEVIMNNLNPRWKSASLPLQLASARLAPR
jgi:hypothetical protein